MLGLYVVRGDNVYVELNCEYHMKHHNVHHSAVVGEVDEERDEALNLASTRAAPLKAVAH